MLRGAFTQLWQVGAALRPRWLLLLRSTDAYVTWTAAVTGPSSRQQAREQAQDLRCTGGVAPWRVGSSQTKDRTCVSCTGRRVFFTPELPGKPSFQLLTVHTVRVLTAGGSLKDSTLLICFPLGHKDGGVDQQPASLTVAAGSSCLCKKTRETFVSLIYACSYEQVDILVANKGMPTAIEIL